jgi:hypothetical protein
MTKIDDYRSVLVTLTDWEPYLLGESNLPGPRGNLELAHAAAPLISRENIERFLALTPEQAPVNSPYEFLVFCGVMGLGRLLREGDPTALARLKAFASDPRWRVREGVATALQGCGPEGMSQLLRDLASWNGNRLEQRAAIAALCEPVLLRDEAQVEQVLRVLDTVTQSIVAAPDRKSEDFKTLRQALGYCWSVAAAYAPEAGKKAMETWMVCSDPDVRWVMKENLKKNRLARMDAAWVESWKARL